MLKSFLLFVLIASLPIMGMAAKDLVTSTDQVTVYHNGAMVERSASSDIAVGTHEFSISGLSSKLVLKSLKIKNKDVTVIQKEIIRKLSPEQTEQLQDRKYALEAQLAMLEAKYAEVGFIQEVADLERMMAFYGSKIQEIKRAMRENDRQIIDAASLENIRMNNDDAAILRLTLSVASPLSEALQLQYVVGGVGWSPAYEIKVGDSSQETLSLKYMAKVMNQSGEDWSNINVRLSSASPIGEPIVLPQPNNPWVLDNSRAIAYQNTMSNAGVQGVYSYQWGAESDIEDIKGIEYQNISVPSFLKARDIEGKVSIPANGTVFTFPIMTVDIAAEYYYYGFPSLDPEVYLVAELEGWDSYGFVDGIADISYGGNEVGRSLILWSEVEETLVLPIGRDNNVYMDRSEIADQKYFKETWSGKKRKSTLAYEFTLKNKNSFEVDFKLMDQLPISQTKSAEVEVETLSLAAYDDQTGEVQWDLKLAPSESVKKQLIYTIDMDAGFSYDRSSLRKKQYRAVRSPQFY